MLLTGVFSLFFLTALAVSLLLLLTSSKNQLWISLVSCVDFLFPIYLMYHLIFIISFFLPFRLLIFN